jgi:hypothetical protein
MLGTGVRANSANKEQVVVKFLLMTTESSR